MFAPEFLKYSEDKFNMIFSLSNLLKSIGALLSKLGSINSLNSELYFSDLSDLKYIFP